jgi:HAD superfamily hydrolase (TIGR01509 family)
MVTNMRIDGIIFDCDGVLVDSETIAVEIDQQMLRELGIDWSRDEITANFLGKSDAHNFKLIETLIGSELPESFVLESESRYREAFETRLQLIPGVDEVISALSVDFCVASSGSHAKIRNSLNLVGLRDAFEGKIFSSSDVSRGKPEPDLFLHAATTMGWEPVNTLVIEDSDAGIEAGLAAGMQVLAYGGGLLDHSNKDHPRIRVIKTMNEIPEVISELLLSTDW